MLSSARVIQHQDTYSRTMRTRFSPMAIMVPFLLSSCGVYQAVHDDAKTDGFSSFALLSPVTAITGIHPPQQRENPLATEAPLIQGRKSGPMPQKRADRIFEAIDKCWPLVKGEQDNEIEASLGQPDLKTIHYRRPAFAYSCQDREYGVRYLELTGL